MWKGEYLGQAVAVKVLRKHLGSDLQMIINVGRRSCFLSMCQCLTEPCTEVLQGGHDVEIPSPSKRAIAGRGDNDRNTVRNGIRMDGEWEHKRLREGTSRCRST